LGTLLSPAKTLLSPAKTLLSPVITLLSTVFLTCHQQFGTLLSPVINRWGWSLLERLPVPAFDKVVQHIPGYGTFHLKYENVEKNKLGNQNDE
jgi:hypothetical protein